MRKILLSFLVLTGCMIGNDVPGSDGDDEVDPDVAAQTWIDANQATWQPWVDAGLAAS